MNIKKDYSLKSLNTFGIDVSADYFVEIFSKEELKEILNEGILSNNTWLVLGGGSNILFISDFKGVVIRNSIPGIEIINEDDEHAVIEAGAGVIWNSLVNYCVERNFGGIENLVLIPGTVGAAPIQNIGAYGQELKDTFVELTGLFAETGSEKTFIKSECNFSYRNSIFKNELKNKFIITSVKLKLKKNPDVNTSYKDVKDELTRLRITNPTIKDVSNVVKSIREGKLPDPDKTGNAGSFFKNPIVTEGKLKELKKDYPDVKTFTAEEGKVKIPAAWLIEKCGWKGKRIGNAGTHTTQPLVLVNYGGASGKEVLDLADKIKDDVYNKFGIQLEFEVNVI